MTQRIPFSGLHPANMQEFENEHRRRRVKSSVYPGCYIQINYTRPDGMNCLRVLSKSAPATTSRSKMEENINVSVMGVSTMKTTARMAQSNRPTEAQRLLKNVKRLVKRGAKSDEQMEEKLAFTTEVEQWDKKLTVEQSRFRPGAIDDTVISDIQKAYMAHSTQHVAVPKKLLLLGDRKPKGASSKDSYYSYKDNL